MKRVPVSGLDNGVELLVNIIDVAIRQLVHTDLIVIAIAGGSCSGKSLLAKKLAQEVQKCDLGVSTLNLDDYYKDHTLVSFPFDDLGRPVFDLPESYFLTEFRSDIMRLLSGSAITSPVYDKKTAQRVLGVRREIKANPVIIAEGLFVIKALYGLSNVIGVFVEVDKDVRIIRRLVRDTGWLHETLPETLQFIEEMVEPYYDKYVFVQKELANIIIINNDEMEV